MWEFLSTPHFWPLRLNESIRGKQRKPVWVKIRHKHHSKFERIRNARQQFPSVWVGVLGRGGRLASMWISTSWIFLNGKHLQYNKWQENWVCTPGHGIYYGWQGRYLMLTPRRWSNWKPKWKPWPKLTPFFLFFFFFEGFGSIFITRTEICFHWQKIHFTHKTHISLTCFPPRQAPQDKCALQFTSTEKGKGSETP